MPLNHTCPEEIRIILLDILYQAALLIRIAGWEGNAKYCAIEADHIHNLPNLMKNYKVELLDHYLRITRSCYLDAMDELQRDPTQIYASHWEQLEIFLSQNK